MINRITDLSPNIPIWFIYGSKSWIDKDVGNIVRGKVFLKQALMMMILFNFYSFLRKSKWNWFCVSKSNLKIILL